MTGQLRAWSGVPDRDKGGRRKGGGQCGGGWSTRKEERGGGVRMRRDGGRKEEGKWRETYHVFLFTVEVQGDLIQRLLHPVRQSDGLTLTASLLPLLLHLLSSLPLSPPPINQ